MADSKKSHPFRAGQTDHKAGSSRIRILGQERAAVGPNPASTSTGITGVHEVPFSSLATEKTHVSHRPPLSDTALKSQTATAGVVASLIGKHLLHFELQSFVGGGGMGAVFRGHDPSLDRVVAVKVLSQDCIDDETIRRFRIEAQSVARLDHPNIPHVYFLGEAEGWHFIVFEFVEGQNIRDLVEQRGPLSVDDILKFLLQIVEAVEHASERGVVHRDIKPSNVLVTPSGKAKLVDMGLARFGELQSSSEDLTATGVTLGTFDYISPEQARDPRSADVRSDIYSLGCTVYYMLTGRPPFPEGTALQKLLSHTTDSPADPRDTRSDLPDDLCDVVGKMLAKQPQDRQQSPNELRAELLTIAKRRNLIVPGQQGTTVVIEREISRANPWVPFAPWLTAAAMLVLTAVGLEWHSSRQVEPAWAGGESPPARPFTGPDSLPAEPGNKNFSDAGAPVARIRPGEDVVPAEAVGARPVEDGVSAGSQNERWREARSLTGESPRAASDRAAVREPNPTTLNPTGSGGDARFQSPRHPAETDFGGGRPTGAGELKAGSAPEPGLPDNTGSPNVADFSGIRTVAGEAIRSQNSMPLPGRDLRTADRAPLQIIVADSSVLTDGDESTLVVDDLERALQLAVATESVESIEIRSNKPFLVSPFAMYNRDLVVAAAEGYRPTWQFAPTLSDLETRRGLVHISSGALRLTGVAMTVSMPAANGPRYSLFELSQAQGIALSDTSITVKNSTSLPYGSEFAIVELKPPAMASFVPSDASGPSNPAEAVTRIDINDCLIRGEATLLRANEMFPLRMNWTNGLFISSERLLNLGGRAYPGNSRDAVQVSLENVTAMLNRGFGLVSTTEAARHLLPLVITAQNNVLISPNPLIVQVGDNTAQELFAQLKYYGVNNHYSGSQTLWEINARQDQQPQSFDFHHWKSYWMSIESEIGSERNDVIWSQALPTQRATFMQEAADYRIASITRRGALLDSSLPVPGAILHRLPIPATIGPAMRP